MTHNFDYKLVSLTSCLHRRQQTTLEPIVIKQFVHSGCDTTIPLDQAMCCVSSGVNQSVKYMILL